MDVGTNGRGRSGTSRKHKSKSPMRQSNNNSRSPVRKSCGHQNNKSRSPTRHPQNNKSRSPIRRHYSNKSKSPVRRGGAKTKKPAAMTVIVNRCDLWDSAAHFQPDECFQPQTQHTVVPALPYRFENVEPTSQFLVKKAMRPPPPPVRKPTAPMRWTRRSSTIPGARPLRVSTHA